MDFLTPAIGEFMKQGLGYVISVILGLYIMVQDKRYTKLQDACNSQADAAELAVKEQYEKRLAEFRTILDAMTSSTHTTNAMHSSLNATTEAINQLVAGFAKLLTEYQASQMRWEDKGGNMSKQLDDIRQKVEMLQRGQRVA
jgi:uncharacterized protein YukE